VPGSVTGQWLWTINTKSWQNYVISRRQVVDIKSKKVQWMGHVIKMDQTRVAVTILPTSQKAQGNWEALE